MGTDNQTSIASFPFLSAFPAAQRGMKIVSEFGAFAQGNVDAFTRSARIATEGATAISQDALALTKANAEKLRLGVSQLAAVRSPAELVEAQFSQTQALFQDSYANFSKFGQAVAALAEQVAAPLTERFTIAAEKLKVAVAV